MKNKINIRIASIGDLPRIVEIYNQAILSGKSTGHTQIFNVEERVSWFNSYNPDLYPLYVYEIDEKVVAYASLSPYREGREAMRKIAEISYYVDFNFHRRGIAKELLKYVLSDCKRISKEYLLAILLDINDASIAFLQKNGFEQWGHFPGVIDIDGLQCGHLIFGIDLNKK